jgi:hypothetical protein
MVAKKVVFDLRTVAGAKKSIRELEKLYGRKKVPSNRDMMNIASEIEDELLKPMLQQFIDDVPPERTYPDDYPIEWTSDKQRKYVMGYVLNGKKHQRTNRLVKGWKYKLHVYNRKISLKIYNEEEESKFVFGKVGIGTSIRSIKRYSVGKLGERPQRFHRITGWKLAYPLVQKTVLSVEASAKSKIMDYINKT